MEMTINDWMPGAVPDGMGATFFRVWAPRAKAVSVVCRNREYPLEPIENGYFSKKIGGIGVGDFYRYGLDGWTAFPDPASRSQPMGVHGPSRVIDPSSFQWSDSPWKGLDRNALVVYEIHVGTFTREGTFRAAAARLNELLDLGVTALEIMPLAECPGRWNWGYDGVSLFAPSRNYGTPDDFKFLVDTCHRKGLAVILDVVYNHIGPEGNYLGNFGPYFSKIHKTPWGDAFNFDGEASAEVRNFIRANVRYWLRDYHLDGLRLDAIRSMTDRSPIPIIHEIAADARSLSESLGCPLHLIGESCVYDPSLITCGYQAVWSDEIPHALLGVVLGQTHVAGRYYQNLEDLGECLDTGYLYYWEKGEILREKTAHRPRGLISQVIQGLQTHDQVGNHPVGHRVHHLGGCEAQRAAAAFILLYPSIPFIFMGEEFSTPSPFCFFVDFGDPWLRDGVIEGRKRDYHHHDWKEFMSPLDEATFLRSKLPSREQGDERTLRWYRELLAIRREWIQSGVLTPENLRIEIDQTSGQVTLRYGRYWVTARLRSAALDRSEKESEKMELEGTILLHSTEAKPGERFLGWNQSAVGMNE